jgi:serine/threonine protein kinase
MLPTFPNLPPQGESDFPRAGELLGDFELLQELGRGSFARVFLARQVSLNRYLALKVSANRGHEAHTLASLEHEHIVQVFDERVDPQRNLRLLYMRYVPGTSLEQVLKALAGRPLRERGGQAILEAVERLGGAAPASLDFAALRDWQILRGCDAAEAACWLGARLAEALAHAHAKGVRHRDVKPANILVSRYGRPLLADFNLAEATRQDGPGGAGVGGTLAYMAPEHLDGFRLRDPGLVDDRSDLYSLGVVLFEMLAGKRPFVGVSGDVPAGEALRALAAERRRQAPSPRRWEPDVPPALDRVIRRCLEPEPGRRYRGAAELAPALDGCLDLRRAEKAMPPAGKLTRAVLRRPQLYGVVLPLLPQAVGAAIDLSYNALWLACLPNWQNLMLPFLYLASGYTLVALLVTGAISFAMTRQRWRNWMELQGPAPADAEHVAAVRRRSLRTPYWAAALTGLGWLPGGFLVPLLLEQAVGPLGLLTYAHFVLSFTLAGLIALTYTLLVTEFLVLRVGYPVSWADPGGFRESARDELRSVGRLLGLLQPLAVLIPLAAGVALMIGMVGARPGQTTTASYQLFQLLVIALIVLGMFGYWLAGYLGGQLRQTLAALLAPAVAPARLGPPD